MDADDLKSGVQTSPIRLAVSNDPGERLVQLLNQSGGEVFAGQRVLARALGVSAGTVNAMLHDLANAGLIVLDAGKSGTCIRLAA